MVRQKVVDYIQNLLQKGYSISAIRKVMLDYGYADRDINEAVDAIYYPTIRHEIHLSKATILVAVFIMISLAGISYFFYYSNSKEKGPSQLLDLKLDPVKTEVIAGEEVAFIKQMSNLGSSIRFDAIVSEEIIDQNTFKVITHNTETIAIETSSSTQTKLLIPKDAKPGDYLLRVTAEYNGMRAFARLPVKIIAPVDSANCFDGIKNQDEESIDCGGSCKRCQRKVTDCNDNNPCTEDKIENGKCLNNPIVPCCGNNICEENEECAADCKQELQGAAENPQTLDDIKETAKTNPEKASKECSIIDVPDLKDTCISNIAEVQLDRDYCIKIDNTRIRDSCYSNVARSINDNLVCQEIFSDGIRDSCYANFFVPPNKDYTVCSKITNKDLMQSCERLKQLYELNQQN